MICPTGQAEYFSAQDWTTQISLNRLTNSAHALLRALVSGKRCDGHSIWPGDRCNVLHGVPAAMELEGVALEEI